MNGTDGLKDAAKGGLRFDDVVRLVASDG